MRCIKFLRRPLTLVSVARMLLLLMILLIGTVIVWRFVHAGIVFSHHRNLLCLFLGLSPLIKVYERNDKDQ
jgi:hypothetical protein